MNRFRSLTFNPRFSALTLAILPACDFFNVHPLLMLIMGVSSIIISTLLEVD